MRHPDIRELARAALELRACQVEYMIARATGNAEDGVIFEDSQAHADFCDTCQSRGSTNVCPALKPN
jgi:hypothetical protein